MGEAGYKFNRWSGAGVNRYKAGIDANYRMRQLGTIALKVQYINILYSGSGDGSIAYEMLDGLSAGHNVLWNLMYQTKLFDYLQLNLQYDGRVTNDGRLIHTGFLQLKAFF